MEKETFGVELELITSKFSQKMESIKSKITNFGKLAKQNFQTGMYMDIGKAKSDLENLKNELKTLTASNYEWTPLGDSYVNTKDRINEIKSQISSLETDIKTFDTSKISKIGQVFGAIKAPIDRIKNSIQQTNKGMNSFSANIKKTFNSGIASIKRFALSLVGIHSIWRGVSRASSAYLSQDIELSNKLQAVWVGLGSLLAPILNNLANFFIKLVSYLNIFIKSLTGVDLLGKAMEKANKNTKDTSKSVKTLKGQLSGFDEINNIADNSSGNTADSSNIGWTDAFKNVQLDTSWTEKITEFGTHIKENWPSLIGIISGVASAIGLVKLNTLGLFKNLTMIKGLGIVLLIAGIIGTISSLIQYIKDPSWENFGNVILWIGVAITGLGILFLGLPGIVTGVALAIVGIVIKCWDQIEGFLKTAENWILDKLNYIEKKFGLFGSVIVAPIKSAIDIIKTIFNGLFGKKGSLKDILDGFIAIFKGNFGEGIKKIFKGIVNTVITGINVLISGLNAVISPIRALIVAVGKVVGKSWTMDNIKIPKIPQLATGTNYVPNDQLAYIHKGEAVVPKKFNSEEFFDRGNDETNSLLRTLIETIENKDSNTYLDGKLIGKTAQSYIINQRRIMGRSVI